MELRTPPSASLNVEKGEDMVRSTRLIPCVKSVDYGLNYSGSDAVQAVILPGHRVYRPGPCQVIPHDDGIAGYYFAGTTTHVGEKTVDVVRQLALL